MSRLFRILTAMVLTVHLIMGCCVHHAHACDGMGNSIPVQGTASLGSQCSDSPGNGSDHANHGSQKCQGEKCSFVLSSSAVGNSLNHPLQSFDVPLLNATFFQVNVVSAQHYFATGQLLLPVRLHLANQVLLI